MLSSFFIAYLTDFIIISAALIFLIVALVSEIISKTRTIDIEKRIYQDDDEYTTTDLLVNSYEDHFVDEIDKSIKGLEISGKNQDYDDLGPIEDPFDQGENEEEFEYFEEVTEEDAYEKVDNFALENSISSETLHSGILDKYWEEISKILSVDFKMQRIALLEADEDGLFSVTKNIGYARETLETLKITEFDKIYSAFFSHNKSLYITDSPFENSGLSKMFSEEDKENIKELIFVPVTRKNEVIAILCISRFDEIVGLDLDDFKERIVLKSAV
jgi:hypothetical protein